MVCFAWNDIASLYSCGVNLNVSDLTGTKDCRKGFGPVAGEEMDDGSDIILLGE